jgi:hypothetical protein
MQPPPANIIHRSTVLKVDEEAPLPSQNPINSHVLPGTSLSSELYHQLGIMQSTTLPSNINAGGALFDCNGALLPGMSYAEMESMLAMTGIPILANGNQQQIEGQAAGGPISETARKEAAAAARAARQAKRKEGKQNKQQRQRKTSNQPNSSAAQVAGIEPAAMAAIAAPVGLHPAMPPPASRAAQPSTSQQPASSGRIGRKTSSGTATRTEQRAVSFYEFFYCPEKIPSFTLVSKIPPLISTLCRSRTERALPVPALNESNTPLH